MTTPEARRLALPTIRWNLRQSLRANWQQWVLALLTTVMFLLSLGVVPFLVVRQSESWIINTNRTDDPDRPLNLYERYEQFNIDINQWIAVTRRFPSIYAENPARMNRPLYPGLASILPRIIMVAARFPNIRDALTEPLPLRLAFGSMLLLNFAMFHTLVQIFYRWVLRHFARSIAFIAALLMVLDPSWLTTAAQVSTAPFQIFLQVVTVYLFDRYLLGENPPSWARIIGLGLVFGVLLQGVMSYDALFACWLWSIYRRRWRVLTGTFIAQIIPLLIWVGIVSLMGLTYYNLEASDRYNQGTWILQLIADGTPLQVYIEAVPLAGGMIGSLLDNFGVLTIGFATIGLIARDGLTQRQKEMGVLGAAGVLLFWVMAHAPGGGRYHSVFFLLYPVAAVGLLLTTRWLSEMWPGTQPSAGASRLLPWFIGLLIVLNVVITWRFHSNMRPPSYLWQPALDQVIDLIPRLMRIMVPTGPEY